MTSTVTTIDANQAVELLERAVKQRGRDYVYPKEERGDRCVYVNPNTGEPDCLVGLALSLAGISTARLREADESEHQPTAEQLIDSLIAEDVLHFTYGAVEVLQRAQEIQDGGDTWGEALHVAGNLSLHY